MNKPFSGPSFCPPSAETELETRRDAIDTELSAVRPIPRLAPTVVENRLAEWQRLVQGNTTQARAVLQCVLNRRIVFTPSKQGYTFAAPTRFDWLVSRIVAPRPVSIGQRTRGWEHLTDGDTFDGDYGRQLARVPAACGRWGTSPTGIAPQSRHRSLMNSRC